MSSYPAEGAEPSGASMFSFTVARSSGVVVVTAHGRLDVLGSNLLCSALVDLIEVQGNLAVVLDAHDLTVTDPSVLEVLVAPSASIARRGGQLSFVDPSDATFVALAAIGLGGAVSLAGSRPRWRESALSGEARRRRSMAQHPARGPAWRRPLPDIPPEGDER